MSTEVQNLSENRHDAKLPVSRRLYPLIDRLQKHSEWKYPERKWNPQFYYDCAFAWMGKEDELEQRVLKLENEMKLANGG
jgi:hypothetical protein